MILKKGDGGGATTVVVLEVYNKNFERERESARAKVWNILEVSVVGLARFFQNFESFTANRVFFFFGCIRTVCSVVNTLGGPLIKSYRSDYLSYQFHGSMNYRSLSLMIPFFENFRRFYRENLEIWTYLGKGPQIWYCTNEVHQALFHFFFFLTFIWVTLASLMSDERNASVAHLGISYECKSALFETQANMIVIKWKIADYKFIIWSSKAPNISQKNPREVV